MERTSSKHQVFHYKRTIIGKQLQIHSQRLCHQQQPAALFNGLKKQLCRPLAGSLRTHVIAQFTITNEVHAKLFSMVANGLVSVRDVIRMT